MTSLSLVFIIAEAVPPMFVMLAIVVGLIAVCIAAFVTRSMMQRKHADELNDLKLSLEKEQQEKIKMLRQQFLSSVSSELQEPMSAIINPLQALMGDGLPDVSVAKVQQSLANAQDLMHRVNMLIDSRYSSSNVLSEFKFVLPKQAAPKVVYVPLEKKQEADIASAKEATNTEDENVTSDTQQDNVVTAAAATSSDISDDKVESTSEDEESTEQRELTAEEKAQFLERVIAKTDAERDSNVVVATVSGTIDDSNASDAANQAWESTFSQPTKERHRFTMLMVDDSPDMCRFARDYFRGEYNVITANNGEQALEKLRSNDAIDLVVSDVTMPLMDGFELCKVIKTDLRWSHIPVILLTGRTAEEMEVQGLKLGADDYITKPFNAETLRLRVKKFIQIKEQRMKDFKENAEVTASQITTTDVDEQFIQKAIKIVEDNMSNSDFSVEALGTELDMSRTYLYKKLVNITGKGPGEFIRILRLKRGKQLLERGQMQIAEVAAAVGYNTPKRFTENFKTEFDMSPSEYLRKVRAEKKG